MEFELTILGSNAAFPTTSRFPPAQILRADANLLMVDCGEGAQIQMKRMGIKPGKITHIFVSHLHADHYAGLIGIIGNYILQNRKEPLHIIGPGGLEEITRLQLQHSGARLPFSLKFLFPESVPAQTKICETGTLDIFSFPLKHRIETYGYLFKEKEKPRKLNIEKAKQSGIPENAFTDLKNGIDYSDPQGNVFKADKYTLPSSPPRSYAYVSDSVYDESLTGFLQNISTLYHEATFAADLEEKARNTMHSTSVQAAKIARLCNAGKLLMGHFSTRYRDPVVLEQEARSVFPESYAVREGKIYKI